MIIGRGALPPNIALFIKLCPTRFWLSLVAFIAMIENRPLSIFTRNSLENVGFQGCCRFILRGPDFSSGGGSFAGWKCCAAHILALKMGRKGLI
jgi:hypothetical protein